MEPVQQVLARIRYEVAITTAAPDVLVDLSTSECDLVSDDDDEGEGGEVESIPDETDYEGNLLDEYETVMAVQEQRVEADVELVLNEYDSIVIDREEAPLWGEIEASPSDRPNQFRPPSSPPSPSPSRNPLPLVPTPLISPQASQGRHPKGGAQATIYNALRPSVVPDNRYHPLAAPPEPSRVSGHFRLMGEVIAEFNGPTQWMDGTMIQAFGKMCCQCTYSHPDRARRVDILPFELLAMIERSKQGIEEDRLELEVQIRRCIEPDLCGMWLIPICHASHWWLIKINWVDKSVHILDSFSSRGPDAMEVLTHARNIVANIHEVLKRPYVLWSSFELDPVSPTSCEYLLH